MKRLDHKYQAFRTLDEALAFGKGVLLTPRSRGNNRAEYRILGAYYVDTDEFPYIRVWNEWVEE